MTGDQCRAAGWRFVCIGSDYMWRHPADIPRGAIDCTDMTDAEFEAFVWNRLERA